MHSQCMHTSPSCCFSLSPLTLFTAHAHILTSICTHICQVAGHSVYTGTDLTKPGELDSWFLEDYQKVPGQTQTFVDHIKKG